MRISDHGPADERLVGPEDDLGRRDVEVALDRHTTDSRAGQNVPRAIDRDVRRTRTDLVELDVVSGYHDLLGGAIGVHHRNWQIRGCQHVVERLEYWEHRHCALGHRELGDQVGDRWQLLAGGQNADRAGAPGLGCELGHPRRHRLDRALRSLRRHERERGKAAEIEVRVGVGDDRVVPGRHRALQDARDRLWRHNQAFEARLVVRDGDGVPERRDDDGRACSAGFLVEARDIGRHRGAVNELKGRGDIAGRLDDGLPRADRGKRIADRGHRPGEGLRYPHLYLARLADDL